MKNKKVLAVVAVLVVILGLYGAYRVYNHFKRLSGNPVSQTQTATTTAPTTLGSLKDLIAKGISQSCSYSSDNTSGTVYMSGGQIRADISAEIDNKPSTSHLIIKDNMTYLWTDGTKTGIKMAYNPNATPSATGGTPSANSSGVLDPNTSMDYKCNPWVADASQFTLPTGVTFSTFTMPSQSSGATPATGSTSSQCSYCDSLTGDNKTQCLTALKCN